MLNAHSSAAIAQVVFYAPMVPVVIYLFSRNARIRPRMAWWPLIPFSLCMSEASLIIKKKKKKRSKLIQT